MTGQQDHLVQEIAFSQAKGINGHTARELLERIGGLEQYFALSQAELTGLTGISNEIFSDAYRRQLLQKAREEADFVNSSHITTLFIDDENYPKRLLNCEDAPAILYKYGPTDLDSAHIVGVVGTRKATSYGYAMSDSIVKGLAEKLDNLVVVSGLAYGIDITAHKASVECGVPTVGVLAHGLKRIYPSEHRSISVQMINKGGALLTAYPSDTTIHRQQFLERNRVIAGLCDCVIVVESQIRGGSMSTARAAMHYDREVMAVPGRANDPYSQGTNALIANNTAALIKDADDIIKNMGWQTKADYKKAEVPTLFRPLSEDEEDVLTFIKENPDLTINDMCVRMGRQYAVLSDILFKLEMDDLIEALPGGRFAITAKIQ